MKNATNSYRYALFAREPAGQEDSATNMSAEQASAMGKAELKWPPIGVPNYYELADAVKQKAEIPRQAFFIINLWNDYSDKDMKLRCFDTGKTEEQLKKEDEKERQQAAERRKQSEAWQAQGLCRYCGGELGMFKKCKSCRMKN